MEGVADMGFLAPAVLLGLLAAGLPWLIHLIGKRRAKPVRFAAMQLLLRAEKRIAARRRLREILLLIARTAIAAALPLIFARPFSERVSDVAQESLGEQSAIIVLDDSASMGRRRGGEALFERARERARTLLRQLPASADVGLLLASAASEPLVGELSLERTRLLEMLEAARLSARAADYPQA
ncbi:MAG TPA: BatA and WFA domain-containing protein, partial [Polyangia bacterium]